MNKYPIKYRTRNEYYFPKINNFHLLYIAILSEFVLFSYVNVMQSSFADGVHITPHCLWRDAEAMMVCAACFPQQEVTFCCVPNEAIENSVSHESGCVTACGPSHPHHHSLLSLRFIESSLSIIHPGKKSLRPGGCA